MPGRSALIVPIDLPSRLLAVRNAYDRMAARGVPPHVTVLFPFLPTAELTGEVHPSLAALAEARAPFVVRFDRVERWPDMVWLLPTESQPFLGLTVEVFTRWPGYPPYEGIHDELIAHLTLVETANAAALDATEAAATGQVPFEVVARELRLIVEDADGEWHSHLRLSLAATPPRLRP
jgi:2'-5' RNA ligase